MNPMMLMVAMPWLASSPASAFCGSYVAPPGAEVHNQDSSVVVAYARDSRTVTLTLVNDVVGDPTDFGLVVPVPSSIDRDNVRTIDPGFVDRLDAYSAPREVAYSCGDFYVDRAEPAPDRVSSGGCGSSGAFDDYDPYADTGVDWPGYDDGYGVVVEDHFRFGVYDAYVLSADDGDGLSDWLDANGWVLPPGAEQLFGYDVDSHTFLAVRVSEDQVPFGWLDPIQIDYVAPSSRLWLPIRLGALSSVGLQDLVVYTISDAGHGTVFNYPETTMETECMRPDAMPLAHWYERRFARTTRLEHAVVAQSGFAWMREFSWTTPADSQQAKCDPCTGLDGTSGFDASDVAVLGLRAPARHGFTVSRLHLRYTPDAVRQDLGLQFSHGLPDSQTRFVAQLRELESLIPTCDVGTPSDPGRCFSSEYLHDRALGEHDEHLMAPEYGCGGRSWLLVLPLLLIGRRRP